jgi:hypothetical protein
MYNTGHAFDGSMNFFGPLDGRKWMASIELGALEERRQRYKLYICTNAPFRLANFFLIYIYICTNF